MTISLEADAVVAAGPSGLAPGPAGGSQLVALDLEAEDVAAALRVRAMGARGRGPAVCGGGEGQVRGCFATVCVSCCHISVM